MEISNYNRAEAPSTNLEFSAPIRPLLKETAKWANFLSILGFIGVAFMIIGGISMIFAGGMLTSKIGFSGVGIGLAYLIVSGIYAIPIYYLNKFASNCRDALQNNDQSRLLRSFEYLKSHYKFLGIFTIVIIALYIVFFLIMIVTGFAFSHSLH